MFCGFIAAKNNNIISNCESIGSFFQFSYISPSIEAYAGAICGENTGRVEYCEVFETSIDLTTGYGGGIVGYNNGGTITHCDIGLSYVNCYRGFSTDNENGYAEGHYASIGGIVGCTSGGTVSYCSVASDVDISYNGYASESRTLAPEMGIIAGRSSNSATETSNTAKGTVDDSGLTVITWTEGWWIFGSEHSWDQAQYVGGNVGRTI